MSESLNTLDTKSSGLDMLIFNDYGKTMFRILNRNKGITHLQIRIRNLDLFKLFLDDVVKKLSTLSIYDHNEEISMDYVENDNIVLNVKTCNIIDHKFNKTNLIFDSLKTDRSYFSTNIFEIKYNGYSMFIIADVLNTIIKDIEKKKFFYNRDDKNYKGYNNYSSDDEDDDN